MKIKLFNLSKPGVIAAVLLGLAATSVRADVEDKITKSFSVQPGGQLVVQVDRGTIEVITADASSVGIEITRKAGGRQSKAEQILKDHVVTTTQKDNTVEVHGEYTGSKTGSPELKISCRITVPRKFDVELKTAGGGITVKELTGKTDARTSGGSLKFEKLEGIVSGRTSGGSVNVTICKGQLDIATSGGDLTLSEIEGDINARTSGGSIRAEKISGKTIVKTSGGDIKVASIKGQIEAATSGGNVTARLLEQPTGDCSFKTSGGSVTVVLGEKAAVDVDARTSAGRVSTDFPVVSVIQGEQKKNELRGKINGGGPLIVAHTSGGSVHLEKN